MATENSKRATTAGPDSNTASGTSSSWFDQITENFFESFSTCFCGDSSSPFQNNDPFRHDDYDESADKDDNRSSQSHRSQNDQSQFHPGIQMPTVKASPSLGSSSLPSFVPSGISDHHQQQSQSQSSQHHRSAAADNWMMYGLELETSTLGASASYFSITRSPTVDDDATDGTTTDIGKIVFDRDLIHQPVKKPSHIPVLSQLPSFATEGTAENTSIRSHRSDDIYSYPSDSFLADYTDSTLSPISHHVSGEGEDIYAPNYVIGEDITPVDQQDFVDINTLLMFPSKSKNSHQHKQHQSQHRPFHPTATTTTSSTFGNTVQPVLPLRSTISQKAGIGEKINEFHQVAQPHEPRKFPLKQ